ncbi:MAG TPA: hypothetical protein VFG45_05635 [Candidatus Nitrosocosmicus sp.]|nr:hypothetical protein [Candidatus Nitrosocosmicus sp.]
MSLRQPGPLPMETGLFLKPLTPGTHELMIKGDINSTKLKNMDISDTDQYSGPIGWNQTTTYILKVD